jgi:uncharacterized SAM-binding protein YcdF (DUF218 family)
MIFSFSHLLEPWLLPPGICFLLILAGFIISFFYHTIGKSIVILGIVVLWLLSTPFIAYHLIDRLQNQYPLLETFAADPASVIVVLGGGNIMQKEYHNKWTVADSTLHRVNYGAFLHQKTQAPILTSGGSDYAGGASEAQLMAEVLKNNFKISTKFIEDKSKNTANESFFVDKILKDNHIEHAYLVTNAWHMPRSVYIFRCRGITVTPAPMGYILYGPGYSILSFFPNIQALEASAIAMHEWIGIAWYHFRYANTCVG